MFVRSDKEGESGNTTVLKDIEPLCCLVVLPVLRNPTLTARWWHLKVCGKSDTGVRWFLQLSVTAIKH